MKKFAVVVAGGSGTRMNSDVPKQFLLLKGKPLLYYSLNTFLKSYSDLEVILVLPVDHLEIGREIISKFLDNHRIRVAVGGETRFHSVKNGLQLVSEDSVVFVHDAVRCLMSIDLVHRCYEAASIYGSAIPVIACKDSVRLQTGDTNRAVERSQVKLVQTPQTFRSDVLLSAFEMTYKENFTDEATVVEAFGKPVHLVEGEEQNFKITLPVDLLLADALLK